MKLIKYVTIAAIALPLWLLGCSEDVQQPSATQDIVTEAPMSPGKQLFSNKCAICHNLDSKKNGPALAGVLAKWNNDRARLKAFIRNSQEAIKAGDQRAIQVNQEWSGAIMTPFPKLTDAELDKLIDYMDKGVE